MIKLINKITMIILFMHFGGLLNAEKICFAQRQRLTYLESVAYWEGAVDRPRISAAFGVSENHVTKDFRFYKETYPGNLQYDETSRVYRPTQKFKPKIAVGSANEYLAILRSYAERASFDVIAEPETPLAVYAFPQPVGGIDKGILNAITRAISSKDGLEISYQSMRRGEQHTKKIWPHALAFSGHRWHTRVYDAEHGKFIDLVLHRILSAKTINESAPTTALDDREWNTVVEIDVLPSAELNENQSEVVAKEFGMIKIDDGKWCWRAKMRECLVPYFIVFNRLDLEKDSRRLIMLRDNTLTSKYLTNSKTE